MCVWEERTEREGMDGPGILSDRPTRTARTCGDMHTPVPCARQARHSRIPRDERSAPCSRSAFACKASSRTTCMRTYTLLTPLLQSPS